MLSKARIGLTALLAVGFSALSSVASAAFIQTVEGNDCSGAYGTFPNCVVNGTPIIIKIGFGEPTEINPLFPTIDGSEFTIVGAAAGTGTWTYNPGPGDPVITLFAAKGGNVGFNLFSNLGDPNSDSWFTPNNPSGQPAGLSHLSFYDTERGPSPVPEPTTMLLLGAGLLAVGIVRRRKRD